MLVVGRSNQPFGFHSAGGQPFMKECVRLLVVLQRENRRSLDYRFDRLLRCPLLPATRPLPALDLVSRAVALAGGR